MIEGEVTVDIEDVGGEVAFVDESAGSVLSGRVRGVCLVEVGMSGTDGPGDDQKCMVEEGKGGQQWLGSEVIRVRGTTGEAVHRFLATLF